MKVFRGVSLLGLLCLVSLPVQASQNGHQLYTGCQLAVAQASQPGKRMDHAQSYDLGYCYGIVQGVSESLKKNDLFCLPENITFSALTEVVVDYLEAYPAQRDLKATAAAYHALLTRYPCPRMRQ